MPVVRRYKARSKLSIASLTSSKFNALPAYLQYFWAFAIWSAVRATFAGGGSYFGRVGTPVVGTYGWKPPGFCDSGSIGGDGSLSAKKKHFYIQINDWNAFNMTQLYISYH